MKNYIYIKDNNNMFERKCPCCNKVILYKHKQSMKKQEALLKKCRSCTVKLEYEKNPDKNKGIKNGRNGKKLIDVMINKYGVDEAKNKYLNWTNNKNSFGFGDKNPQFGKPPFKNGGLSYKGWYKGVFFRSSFELMFLFEMSDRKISSAEGDRFKVKYNDRFFYHPDFFIEDNNTIVEIKSNQWLSNIKNQLKINAAKEHFKNIGIGYDVITEDNLRIFKEYNYDWQKVIYDFLYEQVINGDVKLTNVSMLKLENKLIKTKRISKLNKLKNMK